MAYEAPGITLRQRVTLVPANQLIQRQAHVSGGSAYLTRYADADEKPLGLLGFYDENTDQPYDWPSLPSGAKVDPSYTRLFVDNALLRYFHDAIGSGETILTVEDSLNRIRCAALAFKTNGDLYPRSDEFLDRDVKLGDIVKVRAVVGSDIYSLWTYVRELIADVVDAIVGSAASDPSNAATQGAAGTSYDKVSGADNCVGITAVDQSAYSGLESGVLNEVYTIEVVESSAGGDATTARLRITSASGLDDLDDVEPSAFGQPTEIGASGLEVTFDTAATEDCSTSADDDGVSPDDFIVGQKWAVSASQAFTVTTATSGGTFAGSRDETYIAEVTRGGLYSGTTKPQVVCSTARGTDLSGPTNVTAAATAVACGTQGVTVAFGGTGLRKGDRFIIEAVSETEGYFRTIRLGHNLPQAVIDNGETEIDLSLYIKTSFEIEQNREGFAPLTNWDQTDDDITVNSGLVAYEDSWTDEGVPQPLDVFAEATKDYGQLFVEFRAWRNTLCSDVYEVSDTDDLEDQVPGPIHPDNPLKFGLYYALLNSAGQPVKFTSVCDPDDPDSWANVLTLLDGRRDVYSIAPLTHDPLVWALYEAHTNNQSGETKNRYRELILSQPQIRTKALVNSLVSSDGDEVLATILDDPDTAGTQYTLVAATNVNFVEAGVQPGDQLRALYTTDGWDGQAYQTYDILEVPNESSLLLVSGPASAISTAQKIEVWRNLTAGQETDALVLANTFQNRRVVNVLPGSVVMGGLTVEGYFMAAALAGLISGVEPHRPLTNVGLAGVTETPDTNRRFTLDQLDELAEAGYWIVWYDRELAAMVNRHALTTADINDLNSSLEAKTRNLDDVSYRIINTLRPFIGRSNLTEPLQEQIKTQLEGLGTQLLNGAQFPADIGPQLLTWEILELRQDTTQRNRLIVTFAVTEPTELDYITATVISL